MNIVIIGGGIIGLTTAYELLRQGASVTMVDARETGLGATAVNAGWVVPAEAAPVPGPGVVLTSLKWMLRRDSPLYIRPSLDPSFLGFMTGMWRRSNARDQGAGFAAHLALAEGSIETFDDYRADGMDFEMHNSGLLVSFLDRKNLDHHLTHIDLVRRFGLEPTVLMGDEVRVHEPLLSDAVRGGVSFPRERHIDPELLAGALRTRLHELGALVVENCALEAIDRGLDRVTAVHAGGRRFAADRFILAAGAWTGRLSKLFGQRLPVRPGKGYSIDVAPFGLRSAVNLSDAKVATTPFDDRLRLAGTMEFGRLDELVNQVRVDAILRAPTTYFRDWEPPVPAPVARAGMRPMTPDGIPVIGRLGRWLNVFVSTGHGMLGVTLAPGSARALTEYVLTDHEPTVIAPFSPARFRGGR